MTRHITLPDAAALLCRSTNWFPVWILVCILFAHGVNLPLCTALLTLCGTVCGMLFCTLRSKQGRMHPASAVCSVCLCAGCGFGLYLLNGSLFTAVTLPVITLFTGWTAYGKETDALFTPTRFGALMVGTFMAAVLLFTASLPVPVALASAVCGGVSLLFLLLRNQMMLHRMVNRRSLTETAVPQEIRRSNLRMVMWLMVFLALILIFREPLAAGFRGLGRLLATLVSVIFGAVRQVLALFSSDPAENAIEAAEDVGMTQEAGESNPLINLLIMIPVAAVTVIIWKQFLGEWIEDLRDGIAAFILRMRTQHTSHRKQSDNGEFTDTETAALPEKPRRRRLRQWRGKLRAWQKTPDHPEKFYAGYRLLLDAPVWQRQPGAADTAREICRKWAVQLPETVTLEAPTDALESDRYALHGLPENAIADLNAALTKIAQIH